MVVSIRRHVGTGHRDRRNRTQVADMAGSRPADSVAERGQAAATTAVLRKRLRRRPNAVDADAAVVDDRFDGSAGERKMAVVKSSRFSTCVQRVFSYVQYIIRVMYKHTPRARVIIYMYSLV